MVFKVFWVQLLLWKAGPSLEEAVSRLIGVLVGVTNLERQSAALFLAPEIHSKEMLYVASSKLPSIDFIISVLSIKETC